VQVVVTPSHVTDEFVAEQVVQLVSVIGVPPVPLQSLEQLAIAGATTAPATEPTLGTGGGSG
jgi:hypothetical protein